ncbi:hypothetical protein GBAR_LOCUS175, partial [Geodia barretti]
MSSTVETCVTSHGLTPMTLTAKTSDGKLLSIPFSESSATITELTQPAPTGSRAKALFLLDRFAVSDEFYHELAQIFPEMPRLYQIKGLRKDMNSEIEIFSLPQSYVGRYMKVKNIVEKTLGETLEKLGVQASPPTVTIKFSGDENHTFASVKGPEEYEFLKACFEPVWRELQELIEYPFLCINGTQIQLDIVFGSDYKNYTFSRPDKHLGSRHPPLLQLEPSHYVLDELHLLLRVSDVLVRNVIHLADHLDQQSGLRAGRARHYIPCLEKLVQSCGVPFKISP